MSPRILHLLDETTPPDAVELLAQVLLEAPHEHRIAVLGHRSTGDLIRAAGIGQESPPVTYLHSMGWADPTGWRGVRKIARAYEPSHIHAWGVPAAFATVMSGYRGKRLVTLVDRPRAWHLQLLTFIHKGGLMVSASACQWVVTASWLKRELHALTIGADAVTLVRPSACPPRTGAEVTGEEIRESLGITSAEGPVLLLGGDGGVGTTGAMLARPGIDPVIHGGRGGARHDLGLWTAAILQQIFPNVRAIVREDPRSLPNHGLQRLMNNLADENIVVLAPAQYSWRQLLSISDLLLVTPDGPFAAGSIVHALAARVPVVGTPVDAVREHIVHLQNGILAASTRPREIAQAVESFLSDPALREKITSASPNGNGTLRAVLKTIYAETPVSAWQAPATA